jgi:aminoglycoside 3-N-acetyltransferase
LVLGEDGTLVMPTHSTDLSDPAKWQHPGVPEKWWQQIRDEMPAYSPDLSPTREMGAISECFRKQDGTLRSNHPQVSFAARGKNAAYVTGSHTLEFSMGEGSPLARVYELDGSVLLLGVSHGNSTSIHLAEYRADYPNKKAVRMGAPIYQNGVRQWVWFNDINFDDSDFEKIGGDFSEETHLIISGKVGVAKAQHMPQRQLVDYAARWMEKNRT